MTKAVQALHMRVALEAGELDALAALIAEAITEAMPRRAPFTSPLLVFARMDQSLRAAFFAERPGYALVQEHLLIESVRPVSADQPMAIDVEIAPDSSSFTEISARLKAVDSTPLASLKAGLRQIEMGAIKRAQGLPLGRLIRGETSCQRTQVLSEALAARYADLAGDANLLHRGEEAIIPGAFLAALAEERAHALGDLKSMSIRFTAPVMAGEAVDLVLQARSQSDGQIQARLLYATAARGVVAIADLKLA